MKTEEIYFMGEKPDYSVESFGMMRLEPGGKVTLTMDLERMSTLKHTKESLQSAGTHIYNYYTGAL